MKGYRTIVTNILMALTAILSIYGIDIPPDMIQGVTAGIVSAVGITNLILRAVTTTPIGKRE